MVQYLSKLKPPLVALWCYFVWYLSMMGFYFELDRQVWLTSVGISLIIGLAYNLNMLSGKKAGAAFDPWVAFRFFLMPLCVSSFAGLVKGKGFFMVFAPKLTENLVGMGGCFSFLAMVWIAKKYKNVKGKP